MSGLLQGSDILRVLCMQIIIFLDPVSDKLPCVEVDQPDCGTVREVLGYLL